MKTQVLSILTFLTICIGVHAQNVNIPDANFKNYLLTIGIDANSDNEIQVSEAVGYTGIINCNYSAISDLTGIEAFTNITQLNCSGNNLTSLDLSANTALTLLYAQENDLTSLDVSANTALTLIYAQYNDLTSLDVSNNILLEEFSYGSNSIPFVDISNNTAITHLYVYDNPLTGLNLSNNTNLSILWAYEASLTTLDLSANVNLFEIYLDDNALTSLNVANGNNTYIGTNFFATGTPNLTCIQVDDVAYSTTNWIYIDAASSFSTNCNYPCTVNIPDANFKAYLVGNTAINTNGDTEIQCSEATAFTGNMYCPSLSISDLTGIEAFINLTRLTCSDNALTSIDVSNNTALEFLDCEDNSLTNLDVSNNTALDYLICGENALTNLDVSNNTALEGLICDNNLLTSLDVSSNTALDALMFHHNQITSIDISSNVLLTSLHCYANLLTSLDVSANIYLYDLYCSFNSLTSLDVSGNPNLRFLDCTSNSLTSLNVANGNNASFPPPYFQPFKATNNPDLTCIQIDAGFTPPSNWLKDATASYSTNCSACIVNIPDPNFKAYLVGNSSINTNGDTEIQCSEAIAFTGEIFVAGAVISDLTGIEAFTNLTELNASNNTLTSLDVSAYPALETLACENTSLTSLDISNNTALEYLYCGDNNLGSLDVSGNTNLINLYCNNTSLTSLNLANGNNTAFPTNYTSFTATNNPNLTCIQVDDVAWSTANWTNIDAASSFSTNCNYPCNVNIPDANFKAFLVGNTSINTNNDTEIQCSEATAYTGLINCASLSISDLTGIEAFINITDLLCNDNNLTSIDISAIPNLGGLNCSDNQLTSLDTSLNTSLYNLRCANNALTSIDLSSHPYINTLYCNGNNITTLNLSNLTSLNDLNCSDNQITSIDASNIPLQYFECQNNALTSLNVANGNNYNIVDFDATSNPNLTCINVDDVAYSTANWTNINATASYSTNCSALSVDEFTLNTVSLYPNPTTTVLNIKMNSNLKRATIYSVLGTKVLETTSKTITTSNLKSGLYLITIEADNGSVSTKKFLKK